MTFCKILVLWLVQTKSYISYDTLQNTIIISPNLHLEITQNAECRKNNVFSGGGLESLLLLDFLLDDFFIMHTYVFYLVSCNVISLLVFQISIRANPSSLLTPLHSHVTANHCCASCNRGSSIPCAVHNSCKLEPHLSLSSTGLWFTHSTTITCSPIA